MKIFLYLLIILLLFLQCQMDKEPLSITPPSAKPPAHFQPDTAESKIEITPGVWLIARWKTDSMVTLDDTVRGKIVLKNVNAPQPIRVYITAWPPLVTYSVLDDTGKSIESYPVIVGKAIFDEFVYPGDSLYEEFAWPITETVHTLITDWIRAYSGVYHLYVTMRGLPDSLTGILHHKVIVLPQGNRFDSRLFLTYLGEDSAGYRFVLRNRIPETVYLQPIGQNPLELQWLHRDSLLYVQQLPLNDSLLHLEGHSEWEYTFGVKSPGPLPAGINSIQLILHTDKGDFTGKSFWL